MKELFLVRTLILSWKDSFLILLKHSQQKNWLGNAIDSRQKDCNSFVSKEIQDTFSRVIQLTQRLFRRKIFFYLNVKYFLFLKMLNLFFLHAFEVFDLLKVKLLKLNESSFFFSFCLSHTTLIWIRSCKMVTIITDYYTSHFHLVFHFFVHLVFFSHLFFFLK